MIRSNDHSVTSSINKMGNNNFGFQASLRIKKSDDFAAVFLQKNRISDKLMILYGIRNNLEITRIGLAVGKRIGGAVIRNRYKRLLREAFRTVRCDMPIGFDLVVVPKSNFKPTFPLYAASMKSLSKRLASKIQRTTNNK